MSGKIIGDYKVRKAKVPHVCWICDNEITQGETYMSCFCVDDEKHAWTEKEHIHCHNLMEERCAKCPNRDGECWRSSCLEHALRDSTCVVCKENSCNLKPSKCDKAWELCREKYGQVKK